MTTKIESSRDLVGIGSLSFIRAQTIRVDIMDARPNTRLYPFFDGVRVDEYIQPAVIPTISDFPLPHNANDVALTTLPQNTPIVTNAVGRAAVHFNIPGGRFNTGDRELIFADTPNLADLEVTGNVYGYAKAKFFANGIQEIYQKTITSTKTNVREVIVYRTINLDPLAQSFFTFGVKGGLFLTSIDLFFQSKDATTPVSVEIRPLINGVPGPLSGPDAADRVSYRNAADVSISTDASAATNFKFNVPIYLPEDGEFCFVVRSNSNKYNVWTSKLGERSVEYGYIIHEQPHVGSMFKSENNITWTAEQFEDIKFNLNRAEFNISGAATLDFTGNSPAKALKGKFFSTTNGSNLVVIQFPEFHGLTVGSKISIGATAGANYNGIPAANITGSFNVTRIIDDYFVEISVGANATSSGPIASSGIVRQIAITNGGTGYTSVPSVTIGAPGSGTTATATAVVSEGRVIAINVTNPGSGYTSNPSIIIAGVGTGASAIAVAEAAFTISANTPFEWVSPQFRYNILPGTRIDSTIDSCNDTYGFESPIATRIDQIQRMPETRLAASRLNEFHSLSNNSSFTYSLELSSTNPTVSPVIDIRGNSSLLVYTNAVNNQSREESVLTTTTASSGTVATTTITNGGTGYVSVPSVSVVPAENDRNKNNITAATITATLTGNVVTGLTVSNAGSGYTIPPTIVIAPPSSGTTATANCTISAFNSELMTAGSSYSRYLTRKIKLETVSSGIRLFVLAQSSPETTFDWYIRTSLSSELKAHEDSSWRLLKCDVSRDKSSNENQFFEYEFYLDSIPSFDTYDMKMVPSTSNRAKIPFIKKYRSIVVV